MIDYYSLDYSIQHIRIHILYKLYYTTIYYGEEEVPGEEEAPGEEEPKSAWDALDVAAVLHFQDRLKEAS